MSNLATLRRHFERWSSFESQALMAQRQFGDAIRGAREAAGISQGELAAAADLHPSMLSKVEHGHAALSAPRAWAVMAALTEREEREARLRSPEGRAMLRSVVDMVDAVQDGAA